MSERDWESELKKIDKQMEKVSDEALFPTKGAAAPAQRAVAAEQQRTTTTFGVFARLTLAVALGVGIVFWPYGARCGVGLFAYLGAVSALLVSGVWSSVWTFRHRSGRAHTLAQLLILWGLVLGAIEILPRTGYAKATVDHPATWGCVG